MRAIRQQGGSDNPKIIPLRPREVLSLLIDKGLLDPSGLITSSVRIRPASHRNHNFFIESKGSPSYFLKQGITDATIASIRREAAFYESVSTSFPDFKRYLPGFVCFLPECCILVLELVRRTIPLNHVARRRRAPRTFSNLGTAMALLHSKPNVGSVKPDRRPSPMIVRVGSLSPSELETISAAGVELIRIIQRFPDYETVLMSAFEQSSDRCLTHNDLKSGNCLIRKSPIPILVDWEFAAIGDPAWDVGCIFADVLSAWLLSMPLGSQVSIQRMPTIATQPLELLHPNIRSFWLAYSNGKQLYGDATVAFLLRATKCAGLKLSQSAYEMCQNATSVSAMELFFLQTSWNILKRPTEALVRVFGIPLDDGNQNGLRPTNVASV
jgi:Phosphotransferase enzyme family